MSLFFLYFMAQTEAIGPGQFEYRGYLDFLQLYALLINGKHFRIAKV